MTSIKISPSILSADFSRLGNEIQDLEKAGADLIHIDVMDGHFVPNITIGPEVISKLRKYTSLPFDVHLMISPVNNFIKNFVDAGADIITIHPEATSDLIDSIKNIHEVTVFERSEYAGGLLTLGIPDFKLDKGVVNRRVQLMEAEGIEFRTDAEVGINVSIADLRNGFDATCLAGGSTVARRLNE